MVCDRCYRSTGPSDYLQGRTHGNSNHARRRTRGRHHCVDVDYRRSVLSQRNHRGSLFGDLAAVASELCRAIQRYPVTAWMNADAEVLYQPAHDEIPGIVDWIAGTYSSGASAADIEDDLNQLRAQRRAMGMIEV